MHLLSHLAVLTLGHAPRCRATLTPWAVLTDAPLAWCTNNDQSLPAPAIRLQCRHCNPCKLLCRWFGKLHLRSKFSHPSNRQPHRPCYRPPPGLLWLMLKEMLFSPRQPQRPHLLWCHLQPSMLVLHLLSLRLCKLKQMPQLRRLTCYQCQLLCSLLLLIT